MKRNLITYIKWYVLSLFTWGQEEMSKSEWVVLDAVKQEMRCNRCGDTEPLSLINGRRIDMVCKIINGFRELHDECKERRDAKAN